MGTNAVNYDELPHFVNKRGQRIFCKYWDELNGAEPKALVFVCHGLMEHCLRYDVIAEPLAKLGCFVFSHDHVGHGQSEGPRCHISDFNHFIEDLLQHVEQIKSRYPRTRMFAVGISMGGLMTVKTILDHPNVFDGAVAICALIKTNPETATPLKIFAAKAIARIFPQCPLAPLQREWVTRNEEKKKYIAEDPLSYQGGMKARLAVAIWEAVNSIQARLCDIDTPFLILHGEEDKLCEVSGSRLLYSLIKNQDKTLKIFPDAYHMLLLELDDVAQETVRTITEWIMARSDGDPQY